MLKLLKPAWSVRSRLCARRGLNHLSQKGHEFAEIDLCLKMRRSGYLIVYAPFAKLYWKALAREKPDFSGEAIMRQRWSDVLEQDPYYNPNLARERADFSVGK